jgi:hypothetical protein
MGEPVRIQVTVTDLDTGDSETKVISDDYIVTTAGNRYVASVMAYKNGTHVITVKRGEVPVR